MVDIVASIRFAPRDPSALAPRSLEPKVEASKAKASVPGLTDIVFRIFGLWVCLAAMSAVDF